MKLIIDTGPLVALLNRRDSYHAWVQDVLRASQPPLWTCEPVLTEAGYLTGNPAVIMAMVASGSIRVGLSVGEQAAFLERLLRKYAGRMDLADACVVRLSELDRNSKVLTLDRDDFAVYRRNGRDVIPLVVPPA